MVITAVEPVTCTPAKARVSSCTLVDSWEAPAAKEAAWAEQMKPAAAVKSDERRASTNPPAACSASCGPGTLAGASGTVSAGTVWAGTLWAGTVGAGTVGAGTVGPSVVGSDDSVGNGCGATGPADAGADTTGAVGPGAGGP